MAKTNKVDLSEVFEDGDIPTGQDFKNLISSSLNLNETGSTIQILSSSLTISGNLNIKNDTTITGSLNVSGPISSSGNIEGDSFTIRGLTFVDTNQFSTTESVTFGVSASSDQHRFTGSVFITGSEFDVKAGDSGSINFSTTSGSINFNGTSSFAGPIIGFGRNVVSPIRLTGSLQVSGSPTSAGLELTGSLKISASANSYLSGGKLGIGTPTPEHTLEVTTVANKVVNSSNIIAKFHGDYAGLQGLMVSRSNGANVKLLANYSTYGGGLESSDALRFSTSGSTLSNPSMYIETNGNVGIGTTSPAQKLQITDTAPRILLEGTNASSENDEISRISGLWDGKYVGDIRFLAGDDTSNKDNGKIEFRTYAANGVTGTRMIIDETGNVGIGTLTPTAKLEVVGDISSSGAINTNSNISASGVVTASKLMLSSDELNIGGGIFTSASLAAGGSGGAISSVSNGVDNRVATFTSAGTLNGEANLIFNGQGLQITGSGNNAGGVLTIKFDTSGGTGQAESLIGGSNRPIIRLQDGNNTKTVFSENGDVVTLGKIASSGSFESNQVHLHRRKGGEDPLVLFNNNHDEAGAGSATSTTNHNGENEESYKIHSPTSGLRIESIGGGKYRDPDNNNVDSFQQPFRIFEVTTQTPAGDDGEGYYDIIDFDQSQYWYGRGILYARNAHQNSSNAVSNAAKCITWGHNGSNQSSQDTSAVRVGIAGEGDYTDTNKLRVHGTIRSTQSTNNTSSDRRFKENIKDLEPQLDIIKKLKPRRFDWKKDSPNYEDRFDKVKNQPGFIAQEIEDLIPNAVSKDKTSKGYMSVNYSDLVPMLVKATQEQQEIIESLTKRIEDLENK